MLNKMYATRVCQKNSCCCFRNIDLLMTRKQILESDYFLPNNTILFSSIYLTMTQGVVSGAVSVATAAMDVALDLVEEADTDLHETEYAYILCSCSTMINQH